MRPVHRQSGIAHLSGSIRRRQRAERSAFTLIELLVVIGILSVLTALTVASLRTDSSDRITNATAILKNALEGARSRALRSGEVRGLRLVVDPNDPRVATALQYVGAPEVGEGNLVVTQIDRTQFQVVDSSGVFGTLFGRGLLPDDGLVPNGSRIRVEIPAQSGKWYNVVAVDRANNRLFLAGHYRPSVWDSSISRWISIPWDTTNNRSYPIAYRIELNPIPLPNEDPIPLPPGTCIDLDGSLIPSNWRNPVGLYSPEWDATGNFTSDENGNGLLDFSTGYSSTMDLMFTPQGTLTGAASTRGVLAFHIAETTDAELAFGNLRSIDTSSSFASYAGFPDYLTMADPEKETRALGIYTNTGAIITADVDATTALFPAATSSWNDELASQPFINIFRGRESP